MSYCKWCHKSLVTSSISISGILCFRHNELVSRAHIHALLLVVSVKFGDFFYSALYFSGKRIGG